MNQERMNQKGNRQKRKKQTAVLLLSTALISTNISLVYGAENTAVQNPPAVNTAMETDSPVQSAPTAENVPSMEEPVANPSPVIPDSGKTDNNTSTENNTAGNNQTEGNGTDSNSAANTGVGNNTENSGSAENGSSNNDKENGSTGADTNASGAGTTDSNTTDNGTTGSNTTGNGTTDSNTTGSGNTGSNATDSNTTGSNTTGNGTTNSGTTGNSTTGSNTTGSNTTDNNTAGSNTTDGNTTGTNTTGSNTTGNGTNSGSTADNSTTDGNTAGNGSSGNSTADSNTADKGTGAVTGSEETGKTDSPASGDTSPVPEDTAAAEETTEGTFTNKNGETIHPSTLVGIDYTTIADNYDGETNIIKQYAVSDSYEANTIMESYTDENGNLIMVISQGQQTADPSVPENESGLESAGLFSNASAPSVDGNFSGWDEIPVSYEYNWDNSANCWEYGNWVTDPETGEQICYKTEQGTYDSNVRHEMQLYTDNENVYLKIKYATIYESHANGDDFNFYIDGAGAKYAVTWADGTPITGSTTAAGTYVVDVRNGDSSSSGSIVDGASAYYHVTENGINNELELKIPLSALQTQNGSINLDNFNMIQFFTPNLMYNRISAAGSPTGSIPFAAAAFLCVPAGYVWLKRKNEEDEAFA